MKRALLLLAMFSTTASAALVNVDVVYYLDEQFHTSVASNFSTGAPVSTSGGITAPSGTTGSGFAAFDNGRFMASSTLTRAGAFGFNEGITSSVAFRDALTIDAGGACGGGCQLAFTWNATGSFAATGNPAFAGQLDFAVLNPLTPGDRSTWLVDHPTFLSPGPVDIADSASIGFLEDIEFIFWPVFATVARQVAGSDGQSIVDFDSSFIFTAFSVLDANGQAVPFSILAESGLVYSSRGLAGAVVPEPSSALLALLALGLFFTTHRRSVRRRG